MAQRLTREQMRAKLLSLHVGDIIDRREYNGRIVRYEVLAVTPHPEQALCRTEIGLLEVGKPETYEVPGKFLAAGKMLTMSNIVTGPWYAQQDYMHFEKVQPSVSTEEERK